jgi:adenylyltransferase/sulfurtransferase
VGRLRLIDRDFVDWSNLQRQSLYEELDADGGRPKADAAAERLRRANGEVEVEPVVDDLTVDNAERLLGGLDLIMDGTDNFDARYLINDACVKAGAPWVYAAVVASYGVVMPIVPRETACLRCVFRAPPPPGGAATCDTAGVIGPAVGVIASLACAEAMKLLVGARDRLVRGLTWVDVWHNSFQRTELAGPSADCPTCVGGRFEYLEAPRGAGATTLCGRDAVQVRPPRRLEIPLSELAGRLRPLGHVRVGPRVLHATLGEFALTVFADGRAIVRGTEDPAVARSLYARYVGS